MKEKLIIKNFGGIKNSEIEINQINLFIGPQASGKSIIAKLLYYFKQLPFEIGKAASKKIRDKKVINNLLIDEFRKYFPPHSYPKNKFMVRYEIRDKFFQISFNKQKLGIDFSIIYFSALLEILDEMSLKNQLKTLVQDSVENLILNYKEKIATDSLEHNDLIYIPAGRSFFANIKKDIFSFLTNKINIDPLILEFGRDYNRINTYLLGRNINYSKNILFIEKTKKLLKSEYIVDNEIEYLVHPDKRKIELLYTSSGQQEILPLISTLDFLMPVYTDDKSVAWGFAEGITSFIEEPEAHIFPSGQKEIMELIVLVGNTEYSNLYNRQFIITTHSPYILTSLNNMMYAGYLEKKLKTKKEKAKLYQKLPKELVLNPSKVNVYSVSDGNVESIINRDDHLVSTNIIDKVSDDIAIEFDGLLDIEFEK